MKTIYIKVLRDLKKMKLHTLAIILTLACGIGVYTGVDMGIKSLFYTRDKIFKDMNFADLEIQILPEDIRNLPDFSDIPEIKHVEQRLVMPGIIQLKNNTRLTALMVFQENLKPDINKLEIIEGRNINGNKLDEAIAEKTLLVHHGIKPGDLVELKIGEKIYKNKIVGIGISPEYIIISANPEALLPEKGSLGVVFSSLKQIHENLGFTMVNDILFSYKENVNKKKVQAKILEKLKDINLERVLPLEEHFTYKYLQLDLNAYEMYVPAIVVVLGALSFIITLINFNRLIMHQRKEIGAILAIGYQSSVILKAYALGAGIICIGGMIIGFPLSIFLRNIYTYIYNNAHGLINVYNTVFFVSLVKGVIFALFAIGISFYIPLFRLLKLSPREIIHPTFKESILSSSIIRRVFSSISLLSIGNKLGIRNIFRNPVRSASTTISIAFSIGVTISYMVLTTSTIKTVKERFDRNKWHLASDFLYPVFYEDYEEFKKINGVTEIEPYFRHYVEIGKYDSSRKNSNSDEHLEGSGMIGFHSNSAMRKLPLMAGRHFENKNEIVLSYDLVKKLKLKLGDVVQVKVGMKKFNFTMVGYKSDVIVGETFIDFYRAREIFEFPDEASGVFVKTKPDAMNKVETEIYNKGFVAKVTRKNVLVDKFIKLIEDVTGIIDIARGISIFVALLFIFTSVNFGISEREGEFATLKAIGYSNASLRTIVFAESMTIGVMSSILAIPLASGISVYLAHLTTEAWFNVDNYFEIKDFAWGIVPMLMLIPFSLLPGFKYLSKMNITETIRTKIIE